jgi:hypothetical protein
MANVTLTSLAVTLANPTLGQGQTEHLEAVGSFSDGTTQDLTSQATWASSNTAVATISDAAGSKGLVSALAAGTSRITASLNGITGGTTLTVINTPSPTPLVTVTHVSLVLNRRRMVSQILVTFSGLVDGHGADDINTYRLATAGKRGSFDARNARTIRLGSASLDATGTIATLVPSRVFALAKPVQLRINGLPPAGLEDRLGRLIDGNHDGVPGGNAQFLLRRGGVVVPLVSRLLQSSGS